MGKLMKVSPIQGALVGFKNSGGGEDVRLGEGNNNGAQILGYKPKPY